MKARRNLPLAALAIASIGLASCGSSSSLASNSRATTTTVSQKSRVAYENCLKSHGFTFPKYNPKAKNPPTTVSPSVRKAAVAACANLRPGGRAGFQPSKAQQSAIAAYTACLKSHGVKISTTASNGGPGSFRTLSQSPGFASAAKACASLRPSFGGGRGPGSGGQPPNFRGGQTSNAGG